MKKTLLLLIIVLAPLLLIISCKRNADNVSRETHFPVAVTGKKLPKIPSQKELKASVLESNREEAFPVQENHDRDLLSVIDQAIENPGITEEDLARGWYFSQEHGRKYATPSNWIWIDRGEKSVWIRPGATVENPLKNEALLCDLSGGYFQYSCYDYQDPRCGYIGISRCECSRGTRWLEDEGCVLVDDLNDFVKIAPDELRQGWYFGDRSMKKQGTPRTWKSVDHKNGARWQDSP